MDEIIASLDTDAADELIIGEEDINDIIASTDSVIASAEQLIAEVSLNS